MKPCKLQKDIDYGTCFAKAIKLTLSREERKIVRCILCCDIHNISKVFKYLGVFPDRYNKPIQTGVFIELMK